MPAPKRAEIPAGSIYCSSCNGIFPELADWRVESCSLCAALYKDPTAFAPRHFSRNECQSGGPRRHAGCIGRNSHCTCDRCF